MRPTPKSHLVDSEEQIGQELFLYDEETGAVHTLSSGAAMVWLLCDGERDLPSIAQEIASASNQSPEQVLPQVEEAVAQFQSLDLLEPTASTHRKHSAEAAEA